MSNNISIGIGINLSRDFGSVVNMPKMKVYGIITSVYTLDVTVYGV